MAMPIGDVSSIGFFRWMHGRLAVVDKKPVASEENDNAEKRGDAILKRMLQTPPKPHKEMKGKSRNTKRRPDDKERPSS